MNIGSIFLIVALFIVVALFVLRPLVEGSSVSVSAEEQTLSALMAERDRILDALQELDFDYQLGKVPDADYPAQRARLLNQGVETLKKIDQLAPDEGAQEDALEAAIAARKRAAATRSENGAIKAITLDDEIERLIAARRRERTEKSAGFCSQCGHPVQTSDQFCSKCGATVQSL